MTILPSHSQRNGQHRHSSQRKPTYTSTNDIPSTLRPIRRARSRAPRPIGIPRRRRRHGHAGLVRAHPARRLCCRRREGDISAVVEAAGRIAVRDDLDGGVHAVGGHARGDAEAGHAEGAQAGFGEGRAEDGGEGGAGVVAESLGGRRLAYVGCRGR